MKGYTGIVVDANGRVKYRFVECSDLPALDVGESIDIRADALDVPVWTPPAVASTLETDIAALELMSLADAKLKLRSLLERLRSGER